MTPLTQPDPCPADLFRPASHAQVCAGRAAVPPHGEECSCHDCLDALGRPLTQFNAALLHTAATALADAWFTTLDGDTGPIADLLPASPDATEPALLHALGTSLDRCAQTLAGGGTPEPGCVVDELALLLALETAEVLLDDALTAGVCPVDVSAYGPIETHPNDGDLVILTDELLVRPVLRALCDSDAFTARQLFPTETRLHPSEWLTAFTVDQTTLFPLPA